MFLYMCVYIYMCVCVYICVCVCVCVCVCGYGINIDLREETMSTMRTG
jgi:hypothetical protein